MEYTKLAELFMEKITGIKKIMSSNDISKSTHGEMYVLLYLLKQNRDVMPNEISKEMNISTARIANVLNSLENKKLITRVINKKDRRKILVKITEHGKVTAEEKLKQYTEVTTKILESLGKDDAKKFIEILDKLLINLPNILN